MMKKYILSLDQGTTSSKAVIYDFKGNFISSHKEEYRQIFPKSGYVEHDPYDIFNSQMKSALEVLRESGVSPEEIASIGITNQRETTILWDRKTGKPVYNAIVWQCRRTADYCCWLKNNGYGPTITNKTGLVCDPYFSGTKIKWILDNVSGVRDKAENGDICFGTVDSWLIYNLTEGRNHYTDITNASRTMLFNINTCEWDDDLLELMNIPSSVLPDVKPSDGSFGYTTLFGGIPIPINGVAGDQQASLFGQMCLKKGDIKNTYGTGCFMLLNTGEKPLFSKKGLITTVAYKVFDKTFYALEGSVFVAGAAVQWLRDEMKMISCSAESEKYARAVDSTNGVYFVPAFTGIGAPYWDPTARGLICGISRGTNVNQIVRAALESMAYQTNDVIETMKSEFPYEINTLCVDGGASENSFLMQFQSDISNVNVRKSVNSENTSLGAAFLACIGCGIYKCMDEIMGLTFDNVNYNPKIGVYEREELIKGWKDAINRTINKKNT